MPLRILMKNGFVPAPDGLYGLDFHEENVCRNGLGVRHRAPANGRQVRGQACAASEMLQKALQEVLCVMFSNRPGGMAFAGKPPSDHCCLSLAAGAQPHSVLRG